MAKYDYDDDQLLPEKRAAQFLAMSDRTLRNWRVLGKGPAYVRISARCIRYRYGDLKAFADERVQARTSERN